MHSRIRKRSQEWLMECLCFSASSSLDLHFFDSIPLWDFFFHFFLYKFVGEARNDQRRLAIRLASEVRKGKAWPVWNRQGIKRGGSDGTREKLRFLGGREMTIAQGFRSKGMKWIYISVNPATISSLGDFFNHVCMWSWRFFTNIYIQIPTCWYIHKGQRWTWLFADHRSKDKTRLPAFFKEKSGSP